MFLSHIIRGGKETAPKKEAQTTAATARAAACPKKRTTTTAAETGGGSSKRAPKSDGRNPRRAKGGPGPRSGPAKAAAGPRPGRTNLSRLPEGRGPWPNGTKCAAGDGADVGPGQGRGGRAGHKRPLPRGRPTRPGQSPNGGRGPSARFCGPTAANSQPGAGPLDAGLDGRGGW